MLRVLKLGGSLYSEPVLGAWLDAISMAGQAGSPIVVVPGGGPFADTVRAAQAHQRFSNAIAHHMALLAMEQFGLVLCGMAPHLHPAATAGEINEALSQGLTPVWLPTAMCLHAAEIPQDWTVTSDSLAAWLATRLDAAALGLVKHGPVGVRDFSPRGDRDLVDQAFSTFAGAFTGPVSLLGHDDPAALHAWLEPALA